jgi:hypothetical protein
MTKSSTAATGPPHAPEGGSRKRTKSTARRHYPNDWHYPNDKAPALQCAERPESSEQLAEETGNEPSC